MDEGLQTKRENYRCLPAHALAADAKAERGDRQCDECSSHCRREARREIVLAKDAVAHRLCPVGEGRLVQARLVIEVGNDIVAALDHLA